MAVRLPVDSRESLWAFNMFFGEEEKAVGSMQTKLTSLGERGGLPAEKIDPSMEFAFWRNEFWNRPYIAVGSSYEQYAPAYRYGWEAYESFAVKGYHFKEVEAELGQDWPNHRGQSRLSWNSARDATQDAWRRVQNAAWRRAFDEA